jgi:hypothetical protein
MTHKPSRDLLYDSEAALRQVDSALRDVSGVLEEDEAAAAPSFAAQPDLHRVSVLLERGYREVVAVLDLLRQSRSVLEKATLQKLSHTSDKLLEVSSVTETAATDILDGLERSAALVDELDALDTERKERAVAVRTTLRDELFALIGHMQFQDITSQQLAYASAVLGEMEERLGAIASTLQSVEDGKRAPDPREPEEHAHFDADATTENREARQAIADEIVAAARRPS